MSHGAKDWLMVLFFFGWFLVGASNTLAADAPVPIQSGSDYCDFQRAGNPECIAWASPIQWTRRRGLLRRWRRAVSR